MQQQQQQQFGPTVHSTTIDPMMMMQQQQPPPNHYPPRHYHRRAQDQEGGGGGAATATNPNDPSNEAQLRATLLENYDRNAFPYEQVWATQPQPKTGMTVEFSLNFHKVHALNVAESTAHFVVWVQERWNDPRLAWNPQEYNNVTKTWFYIEEGMGGGEVSEIWTPDIYLWNQEESMDVSLANSTYRNKRHMFFSQCCFFQDVAKN